MAIKNRTISTAFTCGGALLAALAAVSVCAQGEAGASKDETAAAASRPAERSDDAELHRILGERPDVPISRSGAPARTRRATLPVALPVVNRLGELAASADVAWGELLFEPDELSKTPMRLRVLPCRYLEQMEGLSSKESAARFRVTGETFLYRGKGYLLPRNVVVELPGRAVRRSTQPTSAPELRVVPPQSLPASAPAPDAADEADPEDVLTRMLSHQPGRPILPEAGPPQQVTTAPSVAPVRRAVLPSAVADMVIDRVVRVAPSPDSEEWVATFFGDNTLREPPVRLLPCELLQRAEQDMGGPRRPRGGERRVSRLFRVSGELTQYRGSRYLLLRKLIPERDMGTL